MSEGLGRGMRMTLFNGSPRKDGSDARILAEAARIAEGAGFECETIDLYSLGISGCRACMSCKATGRCAMDDGMNGVLEKIRSSDIIVIASPIYFGAETGPVKVFMDRLYPMAGAKDGSKASEVGKLRKVNLLFTCGAPSGAMTYASVLSRYVASFRMMGVEDTEGCIVPGADPESVMDSDYTAGYFDILRYQLEG